VLVVEIILGFLLCYALHWFVGYYFATRAVVTLHIGDPNSIWKGPIPWLMGIFGTYVYTLPFAFFLVFLFRAIWSKLTSRVILAAGFGGMTLAFVLGSWQLLVFSLGIGIIVLLGFFLYNIAMKNNYYVFGYRLFFMVLGWFAFFHAFRVDFKHLADFFSYFTIQSNLFIILWFTFAVLSIFSEKIGEFIHKPFIRSGLLVYITVTMIVFFALLFKQNVGLDFITTYVLHLIIPVGYIVDWFLDKPQIKIKLKTALGWLIYPIIFCIYSLIRGKIVGWYPYWFLSPIRAGSFEHVEIAIVGLACFFFLIIMLVYSVHNKLART